MDLGWHGKPSGLASPVAVDAPIVISNQTGQRIAERLINREFGRYHAGCHSANANRPFAKLTTGFGIALEQRGYLPADRITPRLRGKFQIAVHPHAAMVRLFGLQRIIKYERGRLADRCEARNLVCGSREEG